MKKIILLLFLLIPINVFGFSESASSAIVMDMDSNRIIYSNNIHESRGVASISKIMTAIVAIENININKEVTVGDEIDGVYGSGIYISKGEKLTIKDLLYGLMLRSGNDAALSIAYNVGGSIENFVNMMNEKAIELGMKNTTFNNPTGLDDGGGNISSAYDMALLTSYAMKNSTYREITSAKNYKLETNNNVYSWTNKNKLLHRYDYITGGKTGFTDKARRTLVTTASLNNLNLVVVTLNDGNDFFDHISLYEEVFEKYKNYKILNKGVINVIDDTYYKDSILYINDNYSYPLMDQEINSIILKINLIKKRSYNNGDIVGDLTVKLGDKDLYKTNIYVKNKDLDEDLSLFDKIKKWFKND